MTLFLLSLIGIPPTAGFFAKAYVIVAAVEAGGAVTRLAVIVVINAAIGASSTCGSSSTCTCASR